MRAVPDTGDAHAPIDMDDAPLLQARRLVDRRFAAYIKHMAETTVPPQPPPDPAPQPPARPPEPELGGPSGPEPTRYGDWERGGRCIDF